MAGKGLKIVSPSGQKFVEAAYGTKLWLEIGYPTGGQNRVFYGYSDDWTMSLRGIGSRKEGFEYVMDDKDVNFFRFGTQEFLTYDEKIFEQPIQMEQIQYIVGAAAPNYDEKNYAMRHDAYRSIREHGGIKFGSRGIYREIEEAVRLAKIGRMRRTIPYDYNMSEEYNTVILLDMNNCLDPIVSYSCDKKLLNSIYDAQFMQSSWDDVWAEYNKILEDKRFELCEKIRREIQDAGLNALSKTA